MLTLEQVSAVNDGFARGDLNAALAPLEETIDLRANELPRLDKRSVAALKEGLQNGDDAATWAQAILHPNISVRRFARKVFLGLGDEAAPIFEPLRARLERFWGEEKPLPESNKPREAALRREQNEQVSSALEILLRANPEAFMAFYAQLADTAPVANQLIDEMNAWQEQSARVWQATTKESDRLLREEWGEKWLHGNEKWKLPSRVLRELDERARGNPEIARMWDELGDDPWQSIAPDWNPADATMNIWNGYLVSSKPTGPTERVNARLRPIVWQWVQGSFDTNSAMSERETLANRLLRGHYGYYLAAWLGREIVTQKLPTLLTESKPPLLKTLQSLCKGAHNYYYVEKKRTGKHLIASMWLILAQVLGHSVDKPYHVPENDWQMPEISPQMLRDLAVDLPSNSEGYGVVEVLQRGAQTLEHPHQTADELGEDEIIADGLEMELAADDEEMITEALAGLYGECAFGLEPERDKVERIKKAILALDDDERIAHLLAPPSRLAESRRPVPRVLYWQVWAQALGQAGEEQLKATLWKRVEAPLWERYEEQLQAHRKLETEPIEPDVKRKLTEREAKAWRAQVRAQKRGIIAKDAVEIAHLLIQMGGLEAQLRAIELADRPSCREIRDQLENQLFQQLESYPAVHSYVLFPLGNWGGHSSLWQAPEVETHNWESWKLDENWEPILEKAEARLEKAKDQWTRSSLERQLAVGWYRRGDFERFKSYALRPDAFPQGVAYATEIFDDFEAWRVLLDGLDRWTASMLQPFWQAQQHDESRRQRALEAVIQVVAQTNSVEVTKAMLAWLAPLDKAEFAPYISEIENALESPLPNIQKWAMSVLSKSDDFDRERAACAASEMLWSENTALAKDAAKFLAIVADANAAVAPIVWDALNDATSLENIGLCEAVYRALVKAKSKNKSLQLSDAAREKLDELTAAQNDRFSKFAAKL